MVLKEPPQWYLHHPYALILHFLSLSFTPSPITVPPHTHLSLLTYKSLSRPKAPLHASVLSRVSAGRLSRALGRYCCRGNSDKLLKGEWRAAAVVCVLITIQHNALYSSPRHTTHCTLLKTRHRSTTRNRKHAFSATSITAQKSYIRDKTADLFVEHCLRWHVSVCVEMNSLPENSFNATFSVVHIANAEKNMIKHYKPF